MSGQIVRGVAGRREEYRPNVSKLADSTEPLAIARAIQAQFGCAEFYLADLDAIQGRTPDLETIQQLQAAGLRLWVDAGIRTHRDRTLKMLIVANVARIVVGLESIEGPAELPQIIARVGPERVVFSLDLKAGQPLGNLERWQSNDPFAIAQRAVSAGVRRMIVLDLARVGVSGGVGTEDLCVRLKRACPEVRLLAGGGVRGIDDIRKLRSTGIDNVLVASALHDGRITPTELAQLAPAATLP
jgi:phosphoribosylformimino-5-aminoimidazole carboxamide ribotide isomerase